MKQYITVEQLSELNNKQKKKLTVWLKKNKYYSFYATSYGGLLSIGQMIEFLDENSTEFNDLMMWYFDRGDDKDLCDILWKAVKDVL